MIQIGIVYSGCSESHCSYVNMDSKRVKESFISAATGFFFFLSLPSASVAHSTMGRWISGPPTLYSYSSMCTSSFWPPAQSISSISISDLSFLCSPSMEISGMSHRNNKTWDHVAHSAPLCNTVAGSIKSNKAHWPRSKRITWIICCTTACTLQPQMQKDTVFSPPLRQIPLLYWLNCRLKATDYKTMQGRSCNA